MPTTPKAKAIEIVSAQRTRKTICIHYKQGDGKFDLDERDNPLPAFIKAFDALVALVPTILHLPAAWTENLRVIGIKMGEQGGAATVQLVCRKSLSDASKELPLTTPYRLLAHPAEPGSYTPPLSDDDAALVWEAVEQAKLYVRGDRAQGQIEFESDEDEDADDETAEEEKARLAKEAAQLPLAADFGKPEKKKRGRKAKQSLAAAAK